MLKGMSLDEIADLPDHELRRELLQFLDERPAVSINIRNLRRMVLDEDFGLKLIREALRRPDD